VTQILGSGVGGGGLLIVGLIRQLMSGERAG
jgi:hypothetical protein